MWIKVCGIRHPDDAAVAVQSGVDAIGINFYPGSTRCVSVETAQRIRDRTGNDVVAVGLFVNASVRHITNVSDAVGLSWIQLHGDEPPELIGELRQRRPHSTIIRAVRVGAEGPGVFIERLAQQAGTDARPDHVLVDARVDGLYGGSGQTAPWALLGNWHRHTDLPPLILAGGLRPDNVAQAIDLVHPGGVDVASGVENDNYRKDPTLVAKFIAQCRAAVEQF